MRLRRDSSDPLYLQLKQSLTAEIHSGHYRAHQRLPSERQLTDRFGVSRMTIRQALLELAREGTIYTRLGKGSFVAPPKIDQQLRTLTGFSQDVHARGNKPTSRVLEAKIIPATREVADALRLARSDDVIVLSRLRLADSIPHAIETAYLPSTLCPNLLRHNFAFDSLYDVLKNEYRLSLTQAEQSIEAALASPHEIELLGLQPPAPVLRIQRVTLTDLGMPVEYVASTYRGDLIKFHSVLLAQASK